MASTLANITVNSSGGVESRLDTNAFRKNLIGLQVLIEDKSDYSPFYFNVIKKPSELRLGGNIFEFAPPRNRFKLNSQIIFEAVDSQNNPLAYEILPKKDGSSTIRLCVFIFDTNISGPGVISIVGEALVDDCGCPVPEEWQDKPNCRWTSITPVITDDVSDILEYDIAPTVTVTETKIPWQYQTFEDVYVANPDNPGSAYTVSGSYISKYDSTPTGSAGFRGGAGTGKFTYTKSPKQASGAEEAVIEVYAGNLRFSSSMIGGVLTVSGGNNNHINLSSQDPYYEANAGGQRGFKPNYSSSIVSIINSTKAVISPWYTYIPWVDSRENNYDQERPANSFDAKLGAILKWSETSASIGYTDPTVANPPGSMVSVEKTSEKNTSFANIEIINLKPLCGVATAVEIFVKSTRIEGPITKLTEFPIQLSNLNIDNTKTTEGGNNREFTSIGTFNNQSNISEYWDIGGNTGTVDPLYNTSVLMNSAFISSQSPVMEAAYENHYVFYNSNSNTNGTDVSLNLTKGTNYFINFDAVGTTGTVGPGGQKGAAIPSLELYISGSKGNKGVDPTNKHTKSEELLGEYIGTLQNIGNTSQQYLGNSFEYKAVADGTVNILFVIRTGDWYIRDINITPGPPNKTPTISGRTPNYTTALIPMPYVDHFNDAYTFEFRYKNHRALSNKISTFGPVNFEGNSPRADSEPWFHGFTALTSSKHVHISGNLYVSQSVFASEFHTRVVTSSIIFQEGDTIFGNTVDDTHAFTGNITASGDISASGYVTAYNITASNNIKAGNIISASGNIYGKTYYTWQKQFANYHLDSTTIRLASSGENTTVFGKNILLDGPVTASNNVSASSTSTGSFGDGRFTGKVAIGRTEGYTSTYPPVATLEVSGTVNFTGSLAVSGTTTIHGNTYVTGNLYVSDIVVAQEFHTEYVSASISFASGSNKMGDSHDDNQMMTGSLRVSGAGAHYYIGRQDSSGGSMATKVGNTYAPTDPALVGINTMTPGKELEVIGSISASRLLYISASQEPNQPFNVLVRDPATGEVHYTGSFSAGTQRGIDDTPVDGVVDESISSNWAFDHSADTGPGKHVPAEGTDGHFLKHDGTFGLPGYTTNTMRPAVDISGSLGVNKDFIRTLTATAVSGATEDTWRTVTLKDGEDLGSTEDLIFEGSTHLTITENNGTVTFTSANDNTPPRTRTEISGALGANKDFIRTLTATAVSGASDNTTTKEDVRSAGALMDDELVNGNIKTLTIPASTTITANGIIDWTQEGAGTINASNYSGGSGGTNYTPTDISGSLGINADVIRKLSAEVISGSNPFTAAGISGSTVNTDTNTTYATSTTYATEVKRATFTLTDNDGGTQDTYFVEGAGIELAGGGGSITITNTAMGGSALAAGAQGQIQYNGNGTVLGASLGFTYNAQTNHLIAGTAVTISNSVGESGDGDSPLMLGHVPRESGRLLLWNETSKKLVAGPAHIDGGDHGKGGGGAGYCHFNNTLIAHAFLIQASPAIYAASGSLTFYTGSKTGSRYGHMATGSAIFDMVYDKTGDKSSFIMSGSQNASIYFSGSTSGKIGIGTTDPQAAFEVAADEHIFRRRETLIGLKINSEGNVESFNKDAAFSATGSEVILSYTAGGKSAVTAAGIRTVYGTDAIAVDADPTAINNYYDGLTAKAQAVLLQYMEKIGEFGVGASQVGNVIGSVRWIIASGSAAGGSIDALENRKSGEVASISTVITEADATGTEGKMQLRIASAKAEGGKTRLEIYPNGTAIYSGSFNTYQGNTLFIGETAQDGYDRPISFRHTTAPFIMGIDDSADKFAIHSANAFASTNDLTMDASGDINIANKLTVEGHITASGNISSSGEFIGASAYITNITASGNISASGNIYGADLKANSLKTPANDNLIIYHAPSTAVRVGVNTNNTHPLSLQGHITASGNISASLISTGSFGRVQATRFIGDGSGITGISGLTDNNFTTTLKNKLDAIEASADVTDTTNVTAAGAVMDSEVGALALIKGLTATKISGSSTALSSSIAGNIATNVGAIATNTAKNTNVTTNLTVTTSTTTVKINSSDGTDATIPVATTEVGGVMSKALFDKLGLIEASADVTDAANVTSAGALMDSELSNLAAVKAINQSLVTTANVLFNHVTASGNISASGYFEGSTKFVKPPTTNDSYRGDVVYFGGGSTTKGDVVVLNASGEWDSARANATSTSTGLLGIALNTDPDVHGVLLRGTYTLDHDPGTVGDKLYLSDGTAGQATSTIPDTSGDVVRVIGYCLDSTNGQIWFNPDSTYIELS